MTWERVADLLGHDEADALAKRDFGRAARLLDRETADAVQRRAWKVVSGLQGADAADAIKAAMLATASDDEILNMSIAGDKLGLEAASRARAESERAWSGMEGTIG